MRNHGGRRRGTGSLSGGRRNFRWKTRTGDGKRQGKITRFLHRLEASRFLTRACNPKDRRLLIIKATRRGSRMAPRFRMFFVEQRAKFFDSILTLDIDPLGFMTLLLI